MELYFYYIKSDYIDYLKNCELSERGYTCVPNMHYASTDKFTFGAVLDIHGIRYFAPVSSYSKKQQDNILLKDKTNKVLGSLRFQYMVPVPKDCIIKVDIKNLPTEYNRVHTSKELAFCRRNREKIFKKANKTYNRVISACDEELLKNSCDFKLLEKSYIDYCKLNGTE